jgi:carboxymethylenebutenolidase
MATVKTETVKHPRAGQALIVRPPNSRGVVIAWSDIFQLTQPHVRMISRLASYGFTVLSPEIYARIEPPGTVLAFEADRTRALENSAQLELAWIDEERRAWIDFARSTLGADPLGAARGTAGTLERANELHGDLLLVWGAHDPHIPAEGRAKIHGALEDARVRFETLAFDAEHAFARDEGPRWDPEATDSAFAATHALFERTLAS